MKTTSRDVLGTTHSTSLGPAESVDSPQTAGSKAGWVPFSVFLLVLTGLFARHLWLLFAGALENDLNSYIVLIPLVSAYFLYIDRSAAAPRHGRSIGWAALPLIIGAALLAALPAGVIRPGSENDRLGMIVASFVCFIWAGGFAFLGKRWMTAAGFPLWFLLFLIPLPDQAVDWLETGLRIASAEAANVFFMLTATPALKTGTVFQLPGITIEVAQECSGIRSTWVLLITSIVAAKLFLDRPRFRLALVAAVIPLGILRNGFRIMVIALLCVHVAPDMIHSIIHRRGGPIFFALSLIPLVGILWMLRRIETRPNRLP